MDHGSVRGEGNGLGKNNNEGKKWGGGGAIDSPAPPSLRPFCGPSCQRNHSPKISNRKHEFYSN